MKEWLKNNKEILEIITIVFTILMVLAIFYQAYQSSQQVKVSKGAIDLQYTPQIDIEINSNRIPTVMIGNNYSKGDYFEVYKSDLIKMQYSADKVFITSEVAISTNINFYNLGSVGTKLEGIRYNFDCDPKGERDWQVDILKTRIILPGKELNYNNSLFLDFGEIPNEDKKCSILFKFYFYNNFIKEVKYNVWYHNFESEITKMERESKI